MSDFTPFIQTIVDGREAEVGRMLAEEGADPNEVTDDGWPAIVIAAYSGHEGTVRVLAEAEADLEAKNPKGSTALMLASHKGHEGTVRVLAKAKADLEAKKPDGITALMLASLNGHEGSVRVLAEAKADLEAKTSSGSTALISASQYGHEGAVRVLVGAKADLEARQSKSLTALISAARQNRASCVELLRGAGAESDAVDNHGRTALWWAAQSGAAEAAEALLRHDPSREDTPSDSHSNSGGGAPPAVVDLPAAPWGRGLRKDGGVWDPGEEALHDTTPLAQAVENGHQRIAEALLVAGADPNRTTHDPNCACTRRKLTLRQKAAKKLDSSDETAHIGSLPPLRLACRKEKPQAGMAELLIRAGAEPDVFPSVEEELAITHEATGKVIKLPPRCIFFWMESLGRLGEAVKLRARARVSLFTPDLFSSSAHLRFSALTLGVDFLPSVCPLGNESA
jgi:ankyrin repeat protein